MYSVPFDIPSPPLKGDEEKESLTGFQMPIIHHLGAKALLVDWSNGQGWGSTALTGERKEETVKLSVDSMVISEHTAFVAVDVDQSKPIKGAIQTWDLTAAMANQQYMGYNYRLSACVSIRMCFINAHAYYAYDVWCCTYTEWFSKACV